MITGVTLALAAGIFFACGNFSQKRGVDSLKRITLRRPVLALATLLMSRIWLLGAGLSVVGVGAQLAAYRYVSIAVVQSVGGFGIILLLVIPRAIFGERPSRHEVLGVIIAIVAFGLVITSLLGQSGIHRTGLMTSRTELAMVGMTLIAGVILAIGMRKAHANAALYALSSGGMYGAMGIGLKGASNAFSNANLLSAIERLLAGPIPYSILAAWIAALLVFQIGIQRTNLSIVAPASSVVSMVTVITIGTPLFGEGWPASPVSLSLRLTGVVAILVAFVLAFIPSRVAKPRDSSSLDQSLGGNAGIEKHSNNQTPIWDEFGRMVGQNGSSDSDRIRSRTGMSDLGR